MAFPINRHKPVCVAGPSLRGHRHLLPLVLIGFGPQGVHVKLVGTTFQNLPPSIIAHEGSLNTINAAFSSTTLSKPRSWVRATTDSISHPCRRTLWDKEASVVVPQHEPHATPGAAGLGRGCERVRAWWGKGFLSCPKAIVAMATGGSSTAWRGLWRLGLG